MQGFLTDEELNKTPAPKEEPYKPLGSDNLDSFLKELDQDKQHFDTTEPPIPEEEEQEDSLEPAMPSKPSIELGNRTAGFVVKNVDMLLAYVCAFIAMSDNVETYQGEDTDLEQLAELWGFYFAEKEDFLSPVAMAGITTSFVMWKKVNMAMTDRKQNRAVKSQQKEMLQLSAERDKMLQQKELEELRNEVANLKGAGNDSSKS